MNVWVLEHHNYGHVEVWSEDTDPLEIPTVKSELRYLDGYEDEVKEFRRNIPSGVASIEERFTLTLTEVGKLD